jgi:Protein of unknown function (DUF2628)
MRVYTVHENPAYDDERRVVLVKEGFCWPALFFTIVWAVYRRVWLGLGLYLLGLVAVSLLEMALLPDAGAVSVFDILYALLVGAVANDVRRASLKGRGYREAGVVIGETLDDAEHHWFSGTAKAEPPAPSAPPPSPPRTPWPSDALAGSS